MPLRRAPSAAARRHATCARAFFQLPPTGAVHADAISAMAPVTSMLDFLNAIKRSAFFLLVTCILLQITLILLSINSKAIYKLNAVNTYMWYVPLFNVFLCLFFKNTTAKKLLYLFIVLTVSVVISFIYFALQPL